MHDLIVNNAGAVKTLFIRYLHQRNYDGKLSFDFDDEKLEIKVMWHFNQHIEIVLQLVVYYGIKLYGLFAVSIAIDAAFLYWQQDNNLYIY